MNERKASVNVISNAKEAIEFESVLPVPTIEPMKYFFRDAFYINFKHPLEGIDLYYTTDGSDPNHDSQKVADSMFIKDNFTIKYVASKAGWVSSPIDSILFLRTIQEPATYNLKYPADQKYLGIGKSLLFDMEKGSTNIGDDAWMAFRNNRFILTCEFDEEVELNSIVLSSMVHTNQYIFPPSSIQVKGGLTSHDMKLLGSLKPEQPKERQNQHFDYLECEINSKPLKIVQIIVEPLRKIPDWHRGKGESAWFFIDEVVFQE